MLHNENETDETTASHLVSYLTREQAAASKQVLNRLRQDNKMRRNKQAMSAERAKLMQEEEDKAAAMQWLHEKESRLQAGALRREKVKERMQMMKQKKEEQRKQFEEVKLKVKQVKNHKKPLFKMLEESFDKVQQEEEKERKKKLDLLKA